MDEDNRFYSQLGKRISQIRKEKGIKQIGLAYMIDMDDGSLRKIESGRTKATVRTLRRIAKGLDVHIKDLFDFDVQ